MIKRNLPGQQLAPPSTSVQYRHFHLLNVYKKVEMADPTQLRPTASAVKTFSLPIVRLALCLSGATDLQRNN